MSTGCRRYHFNELDDQIILQLSQVSWWEFEEQDIFNKMKGETFRVGNLYISNV